MPPSWRWLDRDLSWLEFSRRVLAEAIDERTPLLERVKFLAIFTSNLDEFFMKRIAVLREHITSERRHLIGQIRDRPLPMLEQQAEYFISRIVPELSRHGIHLWQWADLSAAQQREAGDYFDPQPEVSHVTVHLDAGVGEGPFDVIESEQPEQRFGVQATLGNGVTLLARIGVASDQRETRTSQQGELLYSLLRSQAHHGGVAAGIGMRHEAGGTNVLLGRVVAGRNFFGVWRLDGNAVFEKPFSAQRDALDLVTTFGVARRLTSAVHVGLEVIGEDLEGFWETDEAEGGARLLAGPSIRIAPPSKRWQASVAGGPVVHATRSFVTSEATRSLPVANRDGYAVRASLTYGF